MVKDEDALICDFAEYYHIYDYEAMDVKTVATLAAGLRSNSRIKTKMANMTQPMDTYLLALCLDALRYLCWTKTKDAEKNRNRPESLADLFMEKEDKGYESFSSIDELRKARNRILGVCDGD